MGRNESWVSQASRGFAGREAGLRDRPSTSHNVRSLILEVRYRPPRPQSSMARAVILAVIPAQRDGPVWGEPDTEEDAREANAKVGRDESWVSQVSSGFEDRGATVCDV